jgi:Ca-activated chloride channel family protein
MSAPVTKGGRRWALVPLCLLLGLAGPLVPARAQSPGSLMLILDASGSMWGQVGGRPKIEVAREVTSDLVEGLPDGIDVGLTVYGRRREGDCNDVESVVALGPLARDGLIAAVRAVQPKGKTPITHSIQVAADTLRGRPGPSASILVSDGEETCGVDPCGLVRELRQSGIDFAVHVVGIDVDPKVSRQLQCIAEAGGGQFYPAASADRLRAALGDAVGHSLVENLVIRAVRPPAGPGERPQPLEAEVAVLSDGAEVARGGGRGAVLRLDPGEYEVVVALPDAGEEQRLAQVAVKAGEKTEREVAFPVSALGALARDSTGQPVEVYLTLYREGEEQPLLAGWTGTSQPHLFPVPPGRYRLVLEETGSRQTQVLAGVTLGVGERLIREVSFAVARVGVVAKDSAGRPIEVYGRVLWPEGDEPVVADEGWSGTDQPNLFDLPPGGYQVEARDERTGKAATLPEVQIGAGQKVARDLDLWCLAAGSALPAPGRACAGTRAFSRNDDEPRGSARS